MRARHTIVEFPVMCHYVVHVEVTSDMAASLKKYPQTRGVPCDDKDAPNCATTVHVKNEPFSFVFLNPHCSTGTIAHECWHVVDRIMRYIEAEMESEVVAYHLGYLVEKVFAFVRR